MFQAEKYIPPLSASLLSAILSRRTAADIIHVLSLPTVPITDVFNTLYHAVQALESYQPSLTLPLIGEVMSVYRLVITFLVLCLRSDRKGIDHYVPGEKMEKGKT